MSLTNPSKFSYRTECVELNSDGTVTMKIWDTKKGKGYKPQQASINAVHCLLYSGLTGGDCGSQNPLLNSNEAIENFEKTYPDFFAKSGDYTKYIRAGAVVTALPKTMGNKSWKVYEVTVNKAQLDKFLTENKIKKSLSHGF